MATKRFGWLIFSGKMPFSELKSSKEGLWPSVKILWKLQSPGTVEWKNISPGRDPRDYPAPLHAVNRDTFHQIAQSSIQCAFLGNLNKQGKSL